MSKGRAWKAAAPFAATVLVFCAASALFAWIWPPPRSTAVSVVVGLAIGLLAGACSLLFGGLRWKAPPRD